MHDVSTVVSVLGLPSPLGDEAQYPLLTLAGHSHLFVFIIVASAFALPFPLP